MNDSEKSEKDDDAIAYYRKLLESDPNNWLYQKFLKMAERSKEPFKRSKPPKIEEEDPQVAGRTGECDVALEVLLEFYPKGEPHRLTTDGTDFAHTFLMYNGKPMDICGITTLDEMMAHYQGQSLKSEPVSIESIRRYFRNNRSPDEMRRYRSLFKKHILANTGSLFPPME